MTAPASSTCSTSMCRCGVPRRTGCAPASSPSAHRTATRTSKASTSRSIHPAPLPVTVASGPTRAVADLRPCAAAGRALCRARGAGRSGPIAGARLGGIAHRHGGGAGVPRRGAHRRRATRRAARRRGYRLSGLCRMRACRASRCRSASTRRRLTVSAVRVQAISLNGFLHEAVLPVERVACAGAGARGGATGARCRPDIAHVAAADLSPGDGILDWTRPAVAAGHAGPDGTMGASARDPRRDIRFFCDEMDLDADGRLTVVGWAVCAVGISAIIVHLDDEEIGEAELGLAAHGRGRRIPPHPDGALCGLSLCQVTWRCACRRTPHPRGAAQWPRRRAGRSPHRPDRACATPPPIRRRQFRLEIDTPTVVAGAMVEPVTGRLTIEGWALARSGITGIEVLLDDQRLGDAHYGLARQDVGTAFPDWVELAAQRLRVPLPAAQPAQRRTRRATQRARAQRRRAGASLQHRGPQVRGIRRRHRPSAGA